MNQVKIDAMQKVLPIQGRAVGGEMEWCVSLDAVAKFYRYKSIDALCDTHHVNLVEDMNMVRGGEVTWMPIGYVTEIVKKKKDLNQAMVLDYLQSFAETYGSVPKPASDSEIVF